MTVLTALLVKTAASGNTAHAMVSLRQRPIETISISFATTASAALRMH